MSSSSNDPVPPPPPPSSARKTFWRSASWSSSRSSADQAANPNPSCNSTSSTRRLQPPPLTPRSKPRSAALPPLQPLSISRRSLDDWPLPGSDDLGHWPLPHSSSSASTPSTPSSSSHPNQIALECSKVADHIYLGGDSVAKNREILRQNSITHVLNCVGFVCPDYFKSDGLIYKTLWLQDSPSEDITSILYDVFDYFEDVREQNGRVFVHCCQGVSRSTSLVIAYLMWRKGQSFDDAFRFVKAARGIANPNMGFACQLLQCQKRVHAIPLSPNSVLRMYRMAPHSPYDPLHLVPKMVNEPKAEALDSRGAFVVHVGTSIYVWIGKGCHAVMEKDARAAAFQVVRYERVPGPVIVVGEGEEPSEFWEAFASLDKGNDTSKKDKMSSGIGKKKVDVYDVDFELFYKAITGGVVPPFPSSGPGQETCLPARESNWSVLRRKFSSGTICRVYSDSALVKESDPRGTRAHLLSVAESSISPPYLSPSSISSDSSVNSKYCSDSPLVSPSTCSSPSLTASPASINLSDFVPSPKPSLQIPGSLEPMKRPLQAVQSPSKGLARSIAERRGSFSLKLPLNKDASLLSRTLLNASSTDVESIIDVSERNTCENDTSGNGLDIKTNCAYTSQCARDSSDNHLDVKKKNFDQSDDSRLTSNSTEQVDTELGSLNPTHLSVYRWPDMKKLEKFGREDIDSKAVLIFLTPSTGRDGKSGRMLYMWIGSSATQANGHSPFKNFGDVDGVNTDGVDEIDWIKVGCSFLARVALPQDLPVKVVKDQEPEEFLKLLNSEWFTCQ